MNSSSVRKKNRRFRIQSCMLLLSKLTSAASMKILCSTRQQCVCPKNIWKKTVLACRVQREEYCSNSSSGGMKRCHLHASYDDKLEMQRSRGNLYRAESNLRLNVDTMTPKQSPLIFAPDSS